MIWRRASSGPVSVDVEDRWHLKKLIIHNNCCMVLPEMGLCHSRTLPTIRGSRSVYGSQLLDSFSNM
ncbi:unnamed protein product [Absidia cylindrospora]